MAAVHMFKKEKASIFSNEGEALVHEMLEQARQTDYGVATRVVLITPELAGDFLSTNFATNRPLRPERVAEYARQMAEGQWTLAEAAIIFDSQGRMVNGQHRLTACIQAATPFLSILAVGLDKNAIINLDTGYVRNIGQSLHIQGISNAGAYATLADYIRRWERRRVSMPHAQKGMGLSRTERLEFISSHYQEMSEAMTWGVRAYRTLRMNRTSFGLCWLVLKKAGGESEAERFFTGLFEGIHLEAGDPRLLLQKRLRESRQSRPDPWVQVYMTIKAWNMWRAGKKGQMLFWREVEGIPEPV